MAKIATVNNSYAKNTVKVEEADLIRSSSSSSSIN